MNTIYKIVRNASTGKWVVASELAKGRKKKTVARAVAAAALVLSFGGQAAFAADKSPEKNDPSSPGSSCATQDGQAGKKNVAGECVADSPQGPGAINQKAITPKAAADDKYIKVNAITAGTSAAATATGTGALAIGDGAQSGGSAVGDTVAIGIITKATGNASTALGRAAEATATQTVAIGNLAKASAEYSLAIGGTASVDATASGGVAIGRNASVGANASNSIALGSNSTVSTADTVSIGSDTLKRKLVNLANGVKANDAVNVDQLSSVVNALGGGAKIDATTGAVTGPTYTLTNGGTQTTVGGALTGLDTAITAVKAYMKINTYAGAKDAIATGSGAIALGDRAEAGATGTTDSIAIGMTSNASGDKAIGIGRLTKAEGSKSVALGDYASVASTATNSVAIGSGAKVEGDATGAVALGNGSVADTANTISVGSSTQQRKIVNVADGVLSATSTDAVTGRQLFATNQNVTTNANNITTLQSQINNGSVGLVQQNATTKKITVASELEGDSVDFSGKKGGVVQSRKLTGLSEGTLSKDSKDAVNGAQLFATNEKVATNTKDIATNTANIATNTTNIATNTSNISSLQTQINDGSIGLVKQDATTGAITMASATGGTTISFAGIGGNRVLSGLANGTGDSDAVTIAQLKAVGLVDPNGKPLAALTYEDLTLASAMLGGAKGTVIRNLANGSIAHGSMEAINGGQLFDFQQDVKNQMDALTGQVNALHNQMDQITQGLNDGSLGGAGGTGAGTNSTTLGEGSNASGAGSTAVGAGANATGDNSTATGANSVASGTNSTANGNGAQALGNNSTATGANAIASGEGSTANGANAVASGNNSTALGSNATASADNSVALGANSVADRDNTVSVGSVGGERQITNVADGTERTDAANWGQVQDAVQGAKDWASRKFEQVDSRIDRMGAMSAAYSQMAFSATGVNTPNRVGVGVGMQGGHSAVAVGISHQISSNLNVSFGGSSSGKETSVGAGMALGW